MTISVKKMTFTVKKMTFIVKKKTIVLWDQPIRSTKQQNSMENR